MAHQDSTGNSVKVVAIIAIIILVALAAWFFMGQGSRQATTSPATSNAPASEKEPDVQVEIDLPDTVRINP